MKRQGATQADIAGDFELAGQIRGRRAEGEGGGGLAVVIGEVETDEAGLGVQGSCVVEGDIIEVGLAGRDGFAERARVDKSQVFQIIVALGQPQSIVGDE